MHSASMSFMRLNMKPPDMVWFLRTQWMHLPLPKLLNDELFEYRRWYIFKHWHSSKALSCHCSVLCGIYVNPMRPREISFWSNVHSAHVICHTISMFLDSFWIVCIHFFTFPNGSIQQAILSVENSFHEFECELTSLLKIIWKGEIYSI